VHLQVFSVHTYWKDKIMKTSVKWVKDAMFLAESGSGHCVVMDGPEDHGGRNMGVRPMEMLLMGLGGCSSFDVMSILKKSRQNVVDCVAELDAQRADAVPSVFTKIHMHFIVTGYSLKDAQVKRAVALSAEKYCSASIMLEKGGVEITHDYEVIELAEQA
jgi:putative redox protein